MKYTLLCLVLFSLFLGACTTATNPSAAAATNMIETRVPESLPPATEPSQPPATSTPIIIELQPTTTATLATSLDNQPAAADKTRVDDQGAVVVEVSPGNLLNPGDTIDFEVALNTHSVNLSMDLAKLATLKTDTGLTASPLSWDGMAGGHHVSGSLTFPTQVDGKNLLAGARVLTLAIRNVDAPERTFTWDIIP